MDQNYLEKRLIERAAIHLFIKRMYQVFGIKYLLISMVESPDAILEDPDLHKLGIEIAHLYRDDEEAKFIFGRGTEYPLYCADHQEYIARLNEILQHKEKKWRQYNHNFPISLLIRSASPQFTIETIQDHLDEIYIPPQAYQNIWLLVDDEESQERWTDLVILK